MQDVILPRHPAEPHAQRHKPRVLRTEGQRLAVLLAVEEQVPLIAFEHGPRDFDGFAQAVLIGPLDEEADDARDDCFDRVLGVAAHAQRLQMLAHEQFHRASSGAASGLRFFSTRAITAPPCAVPCRWASYGYGYDGSLRNAVGLGSLIYVFSVFRSEKPPPARVDYWRFRTRDHPQTPPRPGPDSTRDRWPSNPDTPSVNPDRSASERTALRRNSTPAAPACRSASISKLSA